MRALVRDPARVDRPGPFDRLIGVVLRLAATNVVADMRRMVELVRASELDWTVVRVPMLTDGPAAGRWRVGMVGQGTGPRLSRTDLAAFLLTQLDDRAHLRASPVVSN